MTVLETIKLMPNMKEFKIEANGCCYPFNPADSFHCCVYGDFEVERINSGYEDGTVGLEVKVQFVRASA